MTKEEIGELIAALPQGLDADEFIYRLVNWAVDLERQAIFDILVDCSGRDGMSDSDESLLAYLAGLIKERSEK